MAYHRFIRKIAGKSPIILTAAGVVVTNADNNLLLFKRTATGVWSLPGGHMEIGESLKETALRETLEETGLQLNKLDLIRLVSGKEAVVRQKDGTETHYVTAIFRCTDFTGELQGSAEGEEIAFFSLDNLPSPLSVAVEGAIEYLLDLR